MKKPELLAPAGDFEKLQTALHYGADAVYLGAPDFSLRAKAGNFAGSELADAVAFAHERSRRAYVTANIFAHNRDLGPIREHLEELGRCAPDAVIVADPGVFSLMKEYLPDIPVHISTQANITNREAARFWERLGARRLVLSRELSIAEIREIRDATTAELEVFVHGSICISYSGRCYISSFLASRGANRGACTNSCRWKYALTEEKRPGEYFPVMEDDRGTYLLSSRDLCMIGHLRELADAGVDSFKIEGRMKGINYLAGVVKTYREAIDAFAAGNQTVRSQWLRELSMFSSRGYTTGMFFGPQKDEDYNFDGESYRMTHELVGVVRSVNGGSGTIGLRNRVDTGDEVEYLSPGLEGKPHTVGMMRNADGDEVMTARNEETVSWALPSGVRPGDLVRRKSRET